MGIGDKLTTAEVAAELGKSIRHVQWLITEGKLPAERAGRDYFINADDLKLVKDLKRGRPPKNSPDANSPVKDKSKGKSSSKKQKQ